MDKLIEMVKIIVRISDDSYAKKTIKQREFKTI
jgi:hypothetical protein